MSIKMYGVAFGGKFTQTLAIKEGKLFESSALSQNIFTLMIYFLAFTEMLVSVPQFHKGYIQRSIKKYRVAFGGQFVQSSCIS